MNSRGLGFVFGFVGVVFFLSCGVAVFGKRTCNEP